MDDGKPSTGYMGQFLEKKRWEEEAQLRSLSPESGRSRSHSRGRPRDRTVAFQQSVTEPQRQSSSRSLSREKKRQQQKNLKAVLSRDTDQLPPSAKAEQARLHFWNLVQEAEKVTRHLGSSPPSLKKMNKQLMSALDVASTLKAMEKGKKWASRSLDGQNPPKQETSARRVKSQRLPPSAAVFSERGKGSKDVVPSGLQQTSFSRSERAFSDGNGLPIAASSTSAPFSSKASNIPIVRTSQNTNWEIQSLDGTPSKHNRRASETNLGAIDIVPSFLVSPTKSIASWKGGGGSKLRRQQGVRRSRENRDSSNSRRAKSKTRIGQTVGAYLKTNAVPIQAGGKLSVVGKYLTGIGRIPEEYTQKVLRLFLSNNNLESLAGVEKFQCIETLSLANNLVSKLEQLEPLDELNALTNLNLEGNPVTKVPNFVYQVLDRLPQLELLNKEAVNDYLREEAPSVVALQAEMQDEMYFRAMQLLALSYLRFQLPLMAELRRLFLGDGEQLVPWFAPFVKRPSEALDWLLQVWITQSKEMEGAHFVTDGLEKEAARRFSRVVDACRMEGKKMPNDPKSHNMMWTAVFEELLAEQAESLNPLKEECAQLLQSQIEEFATLEMRLRQIRSPHKKKPTGRQRSSRKPQMLEEEVQPPVQDLPPPKRTFSPEQASQQEAAPGLRSGQGFQHAYQKLLSKKMPAPTLKQPTQALSSPHLSRRNSGTSGGSLIALLPPQQADPEDMSPQRPGGLPSEATSSDQARVSWDNLRAVRTSAELATELTNTLLDESMAEYDPPAGTFGSSMPSFKVTDPQALQALNTRLEERLADVNLPGFELPAIPQPPDLPPPRPFVKAPPGETLKHLQRQAYGLVKDKDAVEPALIEVHSANAKLRKTLEVFKRGREGNIMKMQKTSASAAKVIQDLCEDIKVLTQLAMAAEQFFNATKPVQVDLHNAREDLATLETTVHERHEELRSNQNWQHRNLEDLILIQKRLEGAKSLALKPELRLWAVEVALEQRAEAHFLKSRWALQRAFHNLRWRVFRQRRARLWARRRWAGFIRKVFWSWSEHVQLMKAVRMRVEWHRMGKALTAWTTLQGQDSRVEQFQKAWTIKKAKRFIKGWAEQYRHDHRLALILSTLKQMRLQQRMFRTWHVHAKKSRNIWVEMVAEADLFFLKKTFQAWSTMTSHAARLDLTLLHKVKHRRLVRVLRCWKKVWVAVVLGDSRTKKRSFLKWMEWIKWNKMVALSSAHYLSKLGGKVMLLWQIFVFKQARKRRMFACLRRFALKLVFDSWKETTLLLGLHLRALEFCFTRLLLRTLRSWHSLARTKGRIIRGVVTTWGFWRRGALRLGWRTWARQTWKRRCLLAVQGRLERAHCHLVRAQTMTPNACFKQWRLWVHAQKQSACSYARVVNFMHEARIRKSFGIWLTKWTLRTLSNLLPGKRPFASVRESMAQLESIKSGFKAEVAKLQEDQERFKAQIKIFQGILAEQEIVIQDISGQHSSAVEQNRKLERHLATVQSQIESTEALIGNVHARIRSLKVGAPEDTASEDGSLAGNGQPGGRTSEEVGKLSKTIAHLRQRQNQSQILLQKAKQDLEMRKSETEEKLEETVQHGRRHKQLVLEKQERIRSLGDVCSQQKREIQEYRGKLELFKQDKDIKKTAGFDHLKDLEKKISSFQREIHRAEEDERRHVDALATVSQEINELELQRKEELHKLQEMERMYPELTPQEEPPASQSSARPRKSKRNLPPRPGKSNPVALELASHHASAAASSQRRKAESRSQVARKEVSKSVPSAMQAARRAQAAAREGYSRTAADLHSLGNNREKRSLPVHNEISQALDSESNELLNMDLKKLRNEVRENIAATQTPETAFQAAVGTGPLHKSLELGSLHSLNSSCTNAAQFTPSDGGDLSVLQNSIMELEQKIMSRLGTSVDISQSEQVSLSGNEESPESNRPLSFYVTDRDSELNPRKNNLGNQSWGVSSMSRGNEEISFHRLANDDNASANSITEELLNIPNSFDRFGH